MNNDDLIKKSYDFAADLAKQMITLSTAIITLCVALTGKLFTSESARDNTLWLLWAMICFVVSIAVGIFALMGLTGQLGSQSPQPTPQANTQNQDENWNKEQNTQTEGQGSNISIYNTTNRITSSVQVITFVIGIVLAVTFIWRSSNVPVSSDNSILKVDEKKCLRIIRTTDYVLDNGMRVDTVYVVPQL